MSAQIEGCESCLQLVTTTSLGDPETLPVAGLAKHACLKEFEAEA